MRRTASDSGSDQGAILVHVAFALLALFAFTAFVIDYGVFWESRRQAQNAADSGALAGAIALAFDNPSDFTTTGPAKQSAVDTAQRNLVWGAAPSVIPATDVQIFSGTGVCPPPNRDGTCIQVDVYRSLARGNALPVFFGSLVGLTSQDMRATATAQVMASDGTDCLKPWGVIDKWQENYPTAGPWTLASTFDKYKDKGRNAGQIDPTIVPPDLYVPPTTSSPGTGFRPFNVDGTYSPDYGLQLPLKVGTQSDFDFATGWFSALALTDSRGGKDYENNIKGCIGVTYRIGDSLPIDTEPGEKVGPTRQGVATDADSLISKDPGAYWDSSLNGGRGGVAGSAFGSSPRIVAIPLVNPDLMVEANRGGRTSVPIANIAGFFVERYDNSAKAVVGRLMTMPGTLAAGTSPIGGPSSFLRTVALVR
jgi:Flp pilus assembly protein TadG